MTAGPARKRRSKRSLLARVRTFWLIGVTLALILAAVIWIVATLPMFRLRDITVTGAQHVSRSAVIAAAAIDPHENVWLIDRVAAERRIAALPYVRTARLSRRPPADVWIDVTERVPAACVRDAAGHELLVDGDLRVLGEICTPGTALTYDVRSHLDAAGPGAFLHDPEVLALQGDAQALAADGDRYRAFSHDRFGELEAVMQNGIAVRFGDDGDLDRKQRLIGPILAELGPRVATVRTLDVRAPATPVVEYRK